MAEAKVAFTREERQVILDSLRTAMGISSRASRAATEKGLVNVANAYNETGSKYLQLIAKVEKELTIV